MNGWDTIYTNIANANIGKNLSRSQLLALVTLAGGKSGSQGPTDYRGQRDTREVIPVLDADGKATDKTVKNPMFGAVIRAGSQSSQYRPLLFVGTGDTYDVLPVAERVGKPAGTRGIASAIASATPEQLRDALKKAGIAIPGESTPAKK